MGASADVGKKSFKSNIELLQGPSNPKISMSLRCGGSTQPFHLPEWFEELEFPTKCFGT